MGTGLASLQSAVSETSASNTYDDDGHVENAARGRRAQAVIDPTNSGARVLWFVNGRLLSARHFADWTTAIADLRLGAAVDRRLAPSDDITEGNPVR